MHGPNGAQLVDERKFFLREGEYIFVNVSHPTDNVRSHSFSQPMPYAGLWSFVGRVMEISRS